jgi:4-hydroxy-2-oxoglutarate aldolase
MRKKLEGIFAALTTPFENGQISLPKFKENISKYNGIDLAGYVVAGSSGEAAYLSDEEPGALVSAAKEAAAAGKKLIVGTARESTAATTAFTNRMAELGADAALIRTPSYFKSQMTAESLKKHYRSIADQARIPVIPYHIPRVTGLSITPRLVCELAEHPNITGIKDSSGNLPFLGEAIRDLPPDFSYLLGAGSVLLFGLMLGASGGILRLADVAPSQCSALFRLFKEGKWQEAAGLQSALIPLNNAIIQTHGIAGTKYAMDLLGFNGGLPRLPQLPLEEKDKREIEAIVDRLNRAVSQIETANL